ncbi:hypothetical protein [Candidatus Poriferisocius sp.]|uniref:hypothetical protein n=1 Tax=Candidatus Poriferisocius sp. TaxID=3101276 RepID=UPI003B529E26
MGRWYTSNHHFGHTSIIGYCGRPFADADAMGKEMAARWNDVVADQDEVWILGDLVMGGKAQGLAGHVARLSHFTYVLDARHDMNYDQWHPKRMLTGCYTATSTRNGANNTGR